MKEQLSKALISSLESYTISEEILDPSPLPRDSRYGLVLGNVAAIRRAFDSYPEEAKNEFRGAISHTLSESERKKLDLRTLGEIVYLAGYTQTFEAVSDVTATIFELSQNQEDTEKQRVLRNSIGTLMHLSHCGDEDLREDLISRLNEWFEDPLYERYSAVIMNGMLAIQPEKLSYYFPKFLKIAEENPDYFELDACVDELVRVVTPENLSGQLDHLSETERKVIQARLNR